MKALFLESRAAAEVRHYAANHPEVDVQELLDRTYLRGLESNSGDGWTPNKEPSEEDAQVYSDWWVTRCLQNDSHKEVDIDQLFCWDETEEGEDFWQEVSKREHGEEWHW